MLAFPDRVQEAISTWSRTIGPAPPPAPKSAWLLTGASGIGKTTVVQQTLSLFHEGGDGTPEPDGSVTLGNAAGSVYELVSLSGKRVTVATTGEVNFTDPVAVTPPVSSALTVNRAAVERMVGEMLLLALLGQVAVIDEIGPLLITSDNFSDRVWALLEQGHLLGTINPHPFADRFKSNPAIELIEVTDENRNNVLVGLSARWSGSRSGR